MTQADLIERLEKGEGADRILDSEIAWALGDWKNVGGGYREHKITGAREWFNYTLPDPPVTASLDAAISLVEKMRPGWWYSISKVAPDFWSKGETHPWAVSFNGPVTWATYDEWPEPNYENFEVNNAPSAPRALLIALLKSLQAGEKP